MTRKIDIMLFDPAGNFTIFVLTPTPVSDYQEVANKVLEIDFKARYGTSFEQGVDLEEIKGEQVAFVLEEPRDGYPAMNMCGLEFCGNASRSFAYLVAAMNRKAAKEGTNSTDANPQVQEVKVSVSGCDYPLTTFVDIEHNRSKIQMPTPSGHKVFTAEELGLAEEFPDAGDGILVDMDGISHLVLKDIPATPERFEQLKEFLYTKVDSTFPAIGVMFYDTKKDFLTPVVYVKDVDTTYFEGSCASGTTSTSYVMALDLPDGTHEMTFRQPAGTLYTEVIKDSGKLIEIRLDGVVEMTDVFTVEV